MNKEILNIQQLSKSFDGLKALDKFSCSLVEGEILGLMGPNGAGKSTLFNLVTGFITPDCGSVVFNGIDITKFPSYLIANYGIIRTFQNIRLIRQLTVLDNVLFAFQNQPKEKLRNAIFMSQSNHESEVANKKKALSLLSDASLSEKYSVTANELSYGQQKLLSLVCCLAANPKILLLDEPVAGIAPLMIERILTIIRSLPSAGKSVILIEHNLDAIMDVCHRAVFLDAGVAICEGKPQEVRDDPRVIEAYIG